MKNSPLILNWWGLFPSFSERPLLEAFTKWSRSESHLEQLHQRLGPNASELLFKHLLPFHYYLRSSSDRNWNCHMPPRCSPLIGAELNGMNGFLFGFFFSVFCRTQTPLIVRDSWQSVVMTTLPVKDTSALSLSTTRTICGPALVDVDTVKKKTILKHTVVRVLSWFSNKTFIIFTKATALSHSVSSQSFHFSACNEDFYEN